ncbi:MAG TPA: hypothetical protein VMF13_07670 [Luteitalea sp.]|nr:hypothetical protein [Luteitalea sp.]
MNVRKTGGWLRLLGSLLVVAQVLPGPARSEASVVVPLSLVELTDAAGLIVDATVAEVRVAQGPDGLERVVLLRVDERWKGESEASVYVRLAGGRLGRIETRVAGVPEVTEGDRLVWFLAPHPRGGFSVIGLHQGAMRTLTSTAGESHVLAPSRVAARGDVRRVPRRLSDLASDVRAMVASGAQR